MSSLAVFSDSTAIDPAFNRVTFVSALWQSKFAKALLYTCRVSQFEDFHNEVKRKRVSIGC